jgi:putative Holliday junction resolvase
MAAEYILALDYGDKRVGVAIAHRVARFPRPLTTLANDEHLFSEIRKIIVQEQAGLVVVGLPRGMDGGYTEQTRKAETFAATLGSDLGVQVELMDETLTSVDAEAQLHGTAHSKADIDAVAAAAILERYFAERSTQGVTS